MQRRWLGRRLVSWVISAVVTVAFVYEALTSTDSLIRVLARVIVAGQVIFAAVFVTAHLLRVRAEQS